MAERTVLFDRVNYTVPMKGAPNGRQRMTATKGDKIELDETELKRLEDLGAVGSEEKLNAAIASAAAPTRPTSAADLRLMTVDGLAAYMASATEEEQDQVETWMEELLGEKAADTENARAALARAAGAEPSGESTTTATDEELATMKAGEMLAYLSQHSNDPDEIARVEAANEARGEGKTFKSVTDAIEATRTEQANA